MQIQGNTPQKVQVLMHAERSVAVCCIVRMCTLLSSILQAFNALLLENKTPAVHKKRKTKFKELVSGICGVRTHVHVYVVM